MFEKPTRAIRERVESLRSHLQEENPLLVDVIGSFQKLDRTAYAMGLLDTHESYATRIAWWPLISVLGTFSAGKSTFINQYLGYPLQKTGNQAVDDKFTVICYSKDREVRVLPGLALDADPRFPFYQISEEIEKVAAGEGARVDTYLQLKTCPSERLRGRILIDSPGFDADEQRRSTLRITDHIIELSDLVLVFFDARHPEPGAMQDTLQHLVIGTVRRNDSNKVLFILNQIDTTANEDNAEEVVAAWQRALAQGGLVSGRFYTIYNEEAAIPIEPEELRRRYQSKRDADLAEIYQRMEQVTVERAYRIIGALENLANRIEHHAVPVLQDALRRWRRGVLTLDAVLLGPLLAGLIALTVYAGYWQGWRFAPPWLDGSVWGWILAALTGVVTAGVFVGLHYWIRKLVARRIAKRLAERDAEGSLAAAFRRNTRWWRSLFHRVPVGWTRGAVRRVQQARADADRFVQQLNDRYAAPSGEGGVAERERAQPGGVPETPSAHSGERAAAPGTASG